MLLLVFFFNYTATTEIYTYEHTLSLHDALPIFKPETDLWPVTPAIASDSNDPETVAARAEALARVGELVTLGHAGASFVLDPPAGDATFGAGHATLAVSVGRHGVILSENADRTSAVKGKCG